MRVTTPLSILMMVCIQCLVSNLVLRTLGQSCALLLLSLFSLTGLCSKFACVHRFALCTSKQEFPRHLWMKLSHAAQQLGHDVFPPTVVFQPIVHVHDKWPHQLIACTWGKWPNRSTNKVWESLLYWSMSAPNALLGTGQHIVGNTDGDEHCSCWKTVNSLKF